MVNAEQRQIERTRLIRVLRGYLQKDLPLNAEAINTLADGLRKDDPALGRILDSMLVGRFGVHPQDGEGVSILGASVGPYWLAVYLGKALGSESYWAFRVDGRFESMAVVNVLTELSPESITRFRAQTSTASVIQVDGVPRVLSSGVTEWGAPYCIYECIEGIPLTVHCTERGTPLAEKLMLLLDLVRVVEALHDQMVGHGRLEPSTVLVSSDGRVSLLGVGSCRSSSVADDLRGLGKLMYQLLTGCPVVAGDGDQCLLPSHALGTLEQHQVAATGAIAVAEGSPQPLEKRLRGDLGLMTMKATHAGEILDKGAGAYGTVSELRADLESHILGLPIPSRRNEWVYRIRLWVIRHPLIATGLFVGASLIQSALFVPRSFSKQAEAEQNALQHIGKMVQSFEVETTVNRLPNRRQR